MISSASRRRGLTIFRLAIALPVLGALLAAPPAHAQARGGRGTASIGLRGRGFAYPARRRFFNGSAWISAPYFYSDSDYDSEFLPYDEQPVPNVVAPPAPASAPAAAPVESLMLEDRNGQWVRIPTGSQVPTLGPSTPADSLKASDEEAQPLPKLPPAVLVFRDGHQEEVAKYTIQGATLFTPANYWTTGSWQRKISLSELDIPATLKLNQERGGKFDLPSGPNEVMVRF